MTQIAGRTSCLSKRTLVYVWWGFNTAMSIAFAALAIANSHHMERTWTLGPDLTTEKQGVLTACILGTIMVLLYGFISFILLLKNIAEERPVARFWYGVLLSSSLHVALFMLLPALVLTAFEPALERARGVNDYPAEWLTVFKVTLGLAYFLVVTFLIQFLLFWACKGTFMDAPAATLPVTAPRNPNATSAALHTTAKGKKPSKADQKAIEFNRAIQGGYSGIIV